MPAGGASQSRDWSWKKSKLCRLTVRRSSWAGWKPDVPLEVSPLLYGDKQRYDAQQTRTRGFTVIIPHKALRVPTFAQYTFMVWVLCSTPKISNSNQDALLATELSWVLIPRLIINQGTSCVNFTCECVSSERRPISLQHANDHLSHQSQPHLQIICG